MGGRFQLSCAMEARLKELERTHAGQMNSHTEWIEEQEPRDLPRQANRSQSWTVVSIAKKP